MWSDVPEMLLFVLLLATAIAVVELSDLFAAALLSGILSLLASGLYVLADAVDVAFTEAAVGAGITTVLFLGALSLSSVRERQQRLRWRPLLVIVLVGGGLAYGVLDLPDYGSPDAPIHHHIAPDYIAGAGEMDIPNVVTVVLASYRGYDTLGETTVIFTAALGVLMLLGRAHGRWRKVSLPVALEPGESNGSRRMFEKDLLRTMVRFLAPFILLFAFYVQVHGDFGPGGGFQAGVIFATALILLGLIFGIEVVDRVLPAAIAERLIAIGVLIYGGTGVATLLLGGEYLDYNRFGHHGQHYGILSVETGVGIAVAATMTRIYYAFATLRRDSKEEQRQ